MNSPGELIFWNFAQPKISRERFNEMCRAGGLRHIVAKPKPSAAMSATLLQARKKLKNRFWHISHIKTVDTRKYYGLYEYERDEDWNDLKIEQVATVEFDFKTGELTCDWPHPSFTRLKKIYEYFCKMVSYVDMIDWAARILADTFALCVRARGGVYFVPAVDAYQYDESDYFNVDASIIDAFVYIVNNLPGSCWVTRIPQIQSSGLYSTINRFLLPHVEKTMDLFRSWVHPEIKTALIDDIDTRLHKLDIFKHKMLYYSGLVPDLDFDRQINEVNMFIKRYKARREEAIGLVFTPRQRAQYHFNPKRYEDG